MKLHSFISLAYDLLDRVEKASPIVEQADLDLFADVKEYVSVTCKELDNVLIELRSNSIDVERTREFVHQIRMPLSNVINTASIIQLAMTKNAKATEESVKNSTLTMISKQYSGLKKNISRVIEEAEEHNNKANNLKTLKEFSIAYLDTYFTQLATIASNKNVEFSYSVMGRELKKLFLFENSLYEIIDTLFNNAIDELELNKNTFSKKIEVNCFFSDNFIRFDVLNNGKIISNEFIDKIFKRGFSTKIENGGSGLGLYIVNKEVSEIGGEIKLFTNDIENKEQEDWASIFSVQFHNKMS